MEEIKQMLHALIRTLIEDGVINKATLFKNMYQPPLLVDLKPTEYPHLSGVEAAFLEGIPTFFKHGMKSTFQDVNYGPIVVERDSVSQTFELVANRHKGAYVSVVARIYKKDGHTYLGGTWHDGKPGKMRDLADGEATFQTWAAIVVDMKEMDGG